MPATRPSDCLFTFAALMVVMQLAAISAQAQTRIPVTTCGTVISAPGRYYLANDLNCQSGAGYDVAILIVSGSVELDLDGHQITGSGLDYPNPSGIYATNQAVGNVLVLGPGIIRNFPGCVRFSSTGGLAAIASVTCEGDEGGIVFTPEVSEALARLNTASRNQVFGMIIESSEGEIAFNTTDGNGYDGLFVAGQRNHIHGNTALSNGHNGIRARGTGNLIERNRAQSNREYDLFDVHTTCENLWRNNAFNRANLSCIH